jgi:hypothetical protein
VGVKNTGNFRKPGMGVSIISYREIITISYIMANKGSPE